MVPIPTLPPRPVIEVNDAALLVVDSSIWIDHLRQPELDLARALRSRSVRMHPFVLGEIALGSLANREAVLRSLGSLRSAPIAQHAEVMELIEREKLYGIGIGYVDAHLLAWTLILRAARLWTRDKRLRAAAERLGVAADVR